MGKTALAQYRTRKAPRIPLRKTNPDAQYLRRTSMASLSFSRRAARIVALLANDVPYSEIVKSTGASLSHVMQIAGYEGLLRTHHDRRRAP